MLNSKLFQINNNYLLSSQLFIKLLAIIFFTAFASLSVQIVGLVGVNGILPINEVMTSYYQQNGFSSYLVIPSVFWLSNSDLFLEIITYLGCFFSLTLFLGYYPKTSLAFIILFYLSLYHAGQVFLNFQWDYLIIEMGFIALFLSKRPSFFAVFLVYWLLFRLRFLSGLSKILSDDISWANSTSLIYYFETQPLPHIGSWYAHNLPEWILLVACAMALIIEIIFPFFIFLSTRLKIIAATSTIVLQVIIIATSNHNFVNLLTIILCLFILGDKVLLKILPNKVIALFTKNKGSTPASVKEKTVLLGFVTILSIISILQILRVNLYVPLPKPLEKISYLGNNYGIGNPFHIFPTMQTERHEYEIQGSYDGENWQSYRFNYKPNDLDTGLKFNVPHQPRLDWMIWFIPPQFDRLMPWFDRFMYQLWLNKPTVTNLLAFNPFEGKKPPNILRVKVYKYKFTNWQERKETGNWWKKEYLGIFPNVPRRTP